VLIATGLLWLTRRFVGFRPTYSIPLRAAAAAAVMTAAVALVHPNLPVAIAVGVAVYTASLVVLRVPERLEVRQLLVRRAS